MCYTESLFSLFAKNTTTLLEIKSSYILDIIAFPGSNNILFLNQINNPFALNSYYSSSFLAILISSLALSVLFIIAIAIYLSKLKRQLKNKTLENALQKEEIIKQSEQALKANEALRELGDFRENLTAMMVHDLKNLLNNIINVPKRYTENKQIELMQQSGKQMMNLVSDILDVQKYEETKMLLSPSICTLDEIIEYSAAQIEPMLQQKNINFRNKLRDQYQLKLDRGIIERVVVNLLTNAIKYSPQNAELEIFESVEENMLKICIRDYGPGIPEYKRDLIFTKFAQIHAKKAGLARSTGIGLTFCKIAIEAHGGEIGFESNAGKGTIFWIKVPLEAKVHDLPKSKTGEIAHNKKVLSEATTKKLEKFIEELNQIDVYEVSRIREILKKIESECIDDDQILYWKKNVEDAVFFGNSQKFQELINF